MKSILVVDDEPAVTRLVAKAIPPEYHVVTAHSGEEALIRSKTGPPDLLITDYSMPGMNGDELASRMRERYPGVKTLMLTGFGEFLEGQPPAVDARLVKPLDVRALRNVIAALIGQSHP